MTLKEFIKQFDKEDPIAFLQGKRNVLDADAHLLFQFGKTLLTQTK